MSRMTPSSCRAARGLLDMNRETLAKQAGVNVTTVRNIEDARHVMPSTLTKVQQTFESLGVTFTTRGVEWRDDTITIFEGDDAYARMMQDVYETTKDEKTEVFFQGSNELHTAMPNEIEAEAAVRANGTRFRVLVLTEEGLRWGRDEYRIMPQKYFRAQLTVIYGNKIAQVLEGGRRIVIVRESAFADSARAMFCFVWDALRPLKENTDER